MSRLEWNSGIIDPRGAARVFKITDFVSSVERLAWAHSNGCPWTVATCAVLAKGGHLEALQFARERGCPWVGALRSFETRT